MLNTVLFDVDGTMVDTEYVLMQSLRLAAEEVTGEPVSEEEMASFFGMTGDMTIQIFIDKGFDGQAVQAAWSRYVSGMAPQVQLFDGIDSCLRTLKQAGFNLGVVTSRRQDEMGNEFDALGIAEYFDVIVTASDTANHKPHPDPVILAMTRLGVAAEQTMYIGDTVYDMQAGKSAGATFGLAGWGTKNTALFNDADVILERPGDLMGFIATHRKR